ncbi:MAG TPA: TonB-dependent receptor [Bryobacteraceae bacterium]|nr:TonB-dependent receptor [Bryobacteraceae bacterium]
MKLLLFVPLLASFCGAQQAEPQTIVVTGTYEPVALDEVDRSVTVLPARQNGLVLNTLVDLLKLDPSLDLEERAPDGVQTDLSIRGSSYGQTLVLLNGQRLNDAQSGHHNMDIPVPLDAVSRIEVLRGSGSTLYGSDAAGGAINIITEPPEQTEIRLRTALGNDGINQQRGSISGAFGKIDQQLVFSRDFSTGFMPDRDYRNLQLASITHAVSGLGFSDITLAYQDHPFGADQFYGPYDSWEDTKAWFASLRQSLGKKTTVDFDYRRHSDLFVVSRSQPTQFPANHHADESYQAAIRRQESLRPTINFFYGAEALHESIVSNNLGLHNRSRGAAYASADFRALRRFSLSLSAREEVYRSFSGEFSPTIAGGVWLSPRVKLRASASRAFRVPSYTELYYHDPANIGNPDLRPERAWSYETGVDWNPASRVRAEATIFERRERDGIDYFRLTLNDIWRALNIQNLNFTGVEASLHVAPSRSQTIDFRYTGLRGSQDTVPVGLTKYTFNYPTHSGIIAWQASLPGHMLVRSRVGVLDRRARDTYALWDLYAAYGHGRVHPFLQLANITSTSYQEIQGVQMPGRTVIGGVELVFPIH